MIATHFEVSMGSSCQPMIQDCICKDQHTSCLENLTMRHVTANMAINHDHGYFAIDNVNWGFSLYSLEEMRFLHDYPMGQLTRQFPKQIEFSEGG